MSHKIDERKDNIQKIKETLDNTKSNYEFTNDIIDSIPDQNNKIGLKIENNQRSEVINELQDALKEQIVGKEKKHK